MYKNHLMKDGIPTNVLGFVYLNEALKLYDPLGSIVQLYDDVSKKFGTTGTRVERGIRHAIAKANKGLNNSEYISSRKLVLWADI